MGRWNDKVVAVTGAGSGIGRATAVQLARSGARLALADIDEAGLAETARLLGAAEHTTTRLDVADRDAVYAWAAATQDHFGIVHVVINNAGVSLGATVEDMSDDDFEWLMNIDFWGVVYGTRAFLPHLRASGEGHVVNVSSLFGLVAMPLNSAYNAAKFAVRGFTEALSEELLIEGAPVSVTSVHPGGIDTNIARGGRVTANPKWGLVDSATSGKEFERLARTSPEDAAAQIVRAIERKQRRLLIGTDAKIIDLLQRVLPTRYQDLVVRMVRKERARRAARPKKTEPATSPEPRIHA